MKNAIAKTLILGSLLASLTACQPADVASGNAESAGNVDAATACMITRFNLDSREAKLPSGELMAWKQVSAARDTSGGNPQEIQAFLENLGYSVTVRRSADADDDTSAVLDDFDTDLLVAVGPVDANIDGSLARAYGVFVRAAEGTDLEAIVTNACEGAQ